MPGKDPRSGRLLQRGLKAQQIVFRQLLYLIFRKKIGIAQIIPFLYDQNYY
jgi:hypothetical protein